MPNKLRQSLPASLQNLSAPVASTAVILWGFSPVWAAIIGGGAGLLAVYRELAENRLKELLDDIETHKTEFREEITKTAEFKATFINVWEMHIRENNAAKRKRLRHFLLNLGKGETIPDDTHTKIYAVIEQMTEREAVALGIIIQNANPSQFRHMNLSTGGLAGFNGWSDDQKKDAIHSLYSYRLIDMVDASIGDDMAIRQITPFGELFYSYVVKEPK